MIHLISDNLTKFICKNIKIEEDMTDVHRYGIEITISSALNIILIILTSLILSDIAFGIIFLIEFILLRSFTGGYHADTYFMCNLTFTLTFLSVYGANRVITNFIELKNIVFLLGIIDLLSFITVAIFSPVKNKHKSLSEKQARKCRIKAIIAHLFISTISFIVCEYNIKYGSFMIVTLTAVAVMILIEIIKRRNCHES